MIQCALCIWFFQYFQVSFAVLFYPGFRDAIYGASRSIDQLPPSCNVY